jgi:hypothetical protein
MVTTHFVAAAMPLPFQTGAWHMYVQLANGRVLPLGQLRGSVRAVIVAGTTEQVRRRE